MRCPCCGSENPEGMKLCGACTAPLTSHCPHCGFENPGRFKFCGECGTSLTDQTPALQVPPTERQQDTPKDSVAHSGSLSAGCGVPQAERRQLTVMFCDLVGSTALSEQLDPEELREVLCTYQEVCAEVISRLGGHLAKYLGDGLLVYFGYPLAHEDAVQRAVRAGLEIVEAIKRLNTRFQRERDIRLAVRLGMHTGLVVAGEMGGGDTREPMAIVGETPNIAARLQSLAEPNTVLISTATYRLIQGFFVCQALGMHSLKGISQPMEVYRVLQESDVQSRLEIAVTTGLTPLVGREQEVELLLERWERVKQGVGQVVLLSGEAGIGKSRLVQVMKECVMEEPHTQLECRCSPYHQHSTLYPVIDLLQRTLQLTRDDSPTEKLVKLERFLAQCPVSLPDMIPLFASLLSIPLTERYPPLNLTPQRQKQRTLEALLTILLTLAAQHPVLCVVEDLHWVDPSTLDLLSLLIEQVPTTHLFILLTFRPMFHLPWSSHSYLTHLMPSRLARKQMEAMIERVAEGKALPVEVLQQLVTKTDGVPLFVEELTKMILESGLLQEWEDHFELRGPLPPLAIPATLHDSLMARLDRLATVKAVAQLGAVLGREFSYELLQAVSPLDEGTLQRELARLVEVELLYQRGQPPQATYLFKHVLIQEAAYQSLLRSTRQQYHRQIAQVLAERFPETAETQPELLAHHYEEAGLSEQAIVYWQRAGQRAIQRSAHVEAISHLTKGLELLKALPPTAEHTQQELVLQTVLGQALMATKGYAAPEVEQTYARARELCRQVGETPQLFPVLVGLRAFYDVRSELKTGRELGEQLLRLAQSIQDPARLLEAHRGLGVTLFYLGELTSAQAHLTQGLSIYDSGQHRSLAFLYGQDPGVVCHSYTALILWQLGYPDQALQQSQEALALARELSHPFTLGYALDFAAVLHQFRREWKAAQERAEEAISLATEQGFLLWLNLGTLLRGWALVTQGQREEGIAQLQQGLAAVQSTGAELGKPHFLALLAEAYGEMGQIDKGLNAVTEALATVHKNGERYYEAELYRIKGELLLKRRAKGERGKGEKGVETDCGEQNVENSLPHVSRSTYHAETIAEAEVCFHQALDIARHQQAKSLELRAAINLSRLWQQQGKRNEARQMLAEIYGWFSEGFDTADLQETRALLQTLGS